MKKFCILILAVLISLFASVTVFSQESIEVTDLRSIDAEIKDTNYNEALLMLQRYIKTYPNEFDAAQKRVQRIMKARADYASLSKELLDVIQNEPENNEKKLDIIAQLESIEKHPTAEALEFISQAKIAAQFTYYRAVFTRLMQEGSALVLNENYSDAVNKFKEGFPLYQEDFFDENSDPEIVNPVRDALSEIDYNLPNFHALQDSLTSACNAFIRAVNSGNYSLSTITFAAVQREFQNFANVRNNIVSAGMTFDNVFNSMKEVNPELTDSSFLPFVSRFTFGRGSDPDTGIVGAMDAQWNVLVERMKECVYTQISQQSQSFDDSIDGENVFTVAIPNVSNLISMRDFASLAQNVNNIYSLRNNRSGEPDEPYYQYDSSMQFIAWLSQTISSQLDVVTRFKSQLEENQTYTLPENPAIALRSGQNFATDRKLALVSEFETISSLSNEPLQSEQLLAYEAIYKESELKKSDSEQSENLPVTDYSPPESPPVENTEKERSTPGLEIPDLPLDWQIAENTLQFLCNSTASKADAEAVKEWVETASYFASAGDMIATEYEGQYDWINSLLITSTEPLTSPDGTVFAPGVYPAQALGLVQTIQRSMPNDRSLIVASQDILISGGTYQTHYEDSLQLIDEVLRRLDSLTVVNQTLTNRANEGIMLATRAQNEAELRYNQSVQALNRDDFNSAREYLQRSRTKYNESLTYQTSQELSDSSDSRLIELGERIAARENVVVVSEVRQLKNQARNAYYSGSFEEAENLLTRARTRWATTNIEEDVEITNLTAMVITALSMQTGRVILPTAPLYPEMSQILSIANQYYDQGRELMSEGRREEAEVVLQQAKDKLRELQLVYPLNQEASLLTLRIDQLIDSNSFNEMFARRVNTAKTEYRSDSTRQRAYTDLLDLYTINPSYPGLRQLIYDVEIEIGIRPKPVDRTALARSDSLTTDAQKIVNSSRDEIQLRHALSLVDEAISLNPQNQTAIMVKDRIQTSIGGKATVVLSSADEMRYQQAIQELQNNNIIGAYAIVQQLLQSPANARSSKVLDLQKRLQALL